MTDISSAHPGKGSLSEVNSSLNGLKPTQLLWRQFISLVSLSAKKYLFTRYMWVLLILGGFPLIISIFFAISTIFSGHFHSVSAPPILEISKTFQIMFRVFYIHFIIFFVANIFGFSLLRKELDDQTLHYLFLQPVKKVIIILSKYIAFVFIAWIYLSVIFILTYFVFLLPYGLRNLANELFEKGRALSLIKEVFVILIALFIYGSISMVMGSIVKSGLYGVIFYLWETALPYLPSTLKSFTISHYLQALTPEKSAIPPRMFEIYGQLPSLFRCFTTLSIILFVFLILTIFIIHRYECKYA